MLVLASAKGIRQNKIVDVKGGYTMAIRQERNLYGTISAYDPKTKLGVIQMADGNTYRFGTTSFKGQFKESPETVTKDKKVFFDLLFIVGEPPVRNMTPMRGAALVDKTRRAATIDSIENGRAYFSALGRKLNVSLNAIKHPNETRITVGSVVVFYMTKTADNKTFYAERIRLQ